MNCLHYNKDVDSDFGKLPSEIWAVLKETVESYSEDRAAVWAAALAYYGLFSIFPLLLFLFYLGSRVLEESQAAMTLNLILSRSLPIDINNINRVVESTMEARGSIGLIGAVGLIWSASAVFAVLESALNTIWGGSPRPFWRGRLLASGAILAVSLAFVASMGLAPLLSLVFTATDSPSQQLLGGLLSFTLLVLVSYMLYRAFPSNEVRRLPALGGAVASALLLFLARAIIDVYLSSAFTNFGAVYGSLTWIIYLAFWTYIAGTLLLLGAEFGSAMQKKAFFRRLFKLQ